jgi:hypothetical protein
VAPTRSAGVTSASLQTRDTGVFRYLAVAVL